MQPGRLQSVVHLDLAAVHFDVVLRQQRLGDLLAGHGSKQLAILAGLGADLHSHVLDAPGDFAGSLFVDGFAVGLRILLLLDGVHVTGGGLHGQIAREQEVAGIPVADVQNVALFTGAFDVLVENNFHGFISSPCDMVSGH